MGTKKIACIGDAAYIEQTTKQAKAITDEALAWVAIQVALMAAQYSTSTSIADMQKGLAQRRLNMANDAIAHAKKTWEKEYAFVAETMSEAAYTPQYGFAQIMLNEVDRVEDVAVEAVDTRLSRLGLTVGACDDARTRRGMATARTDLVSHAMRAAEGRAIALNDRRFSRQLAAVGLGRGKLQNALSIGQLADKGPALRGSLLATINSGMQLWGYSANRWRHGGNFHTGARGAPRVVPEGYSLMQTGDTAYLERDRLSDALSALAPAKTDMTPTSQSDTNGDAF